MAGLPYFSRSRFTQQVIMSSELMSSPSKSKMQARTGGKLMIVCQYIILECIRQTLLLGPAKRHARDVYFHLEWADEGKQ